MVLVSRVRAVFKFGIPFAVMLGCIWMLRDRATSVNYGDFRSAVSDVSAIQLSLALGLTALSFWALAHYDVIAHRHVRTGVSNLRAKASGLIAIALSQTLGFGMIVGALIRWRLLPELRSTSAAAITAVSALLFIGALFLLTCLALAILPGQTGLRLPAALLFCAGLVGVLVILANPRLNILNREVRLPSLLSVGAAALWVAVDVIAAAGVFYVFLPEDFSLTFLTFLPLFMLAFATGMVLGTPGGIGPFELTLLSLLPADQRVAPVLMAVVLFRLTYFALPAVIASCFVWRSFGPERIVTSPDVGCSLRDLRAEANVLEQSDGSGILLARRRLAIWSTDHSQVGLYDPDQAVAGNFFSALKRRARNRNALTGLYKCSAQTALSARKSGWACLRIAEEAMIDVSRFTLHGKATRQLRRKLRQAELAGVRVRPVYACDWPELAAIDRSWQACHGHARGGTMGRFCKTYLARQHVLVAEVNSDVIAFASFHKTADEWALDLIRHTDTMPQGTMHALVSTAIENARTLDVPRLSLAATPNIPLRESFRPHLLSSALHKRLRAPGLRQFKAAFNPKWRPLYAVAPSKTELALILVDIALAVHRPAPLPDQKALKTSRIHVNNENYEVDSSLAA